ncbi:MAG: hypothetical protein PHS41_04045 [Victivallaceae bacterium]|nr:hypothetical protein [Victivallaceae bacterium]
MQISPIMCWNNKNNLWSNRKAGSPRFPFTLLELIVVMAILFLTATLAVAVLKEESPARKLERAGAEFEAFCAGARFRATEEGRDVIVAFDAENKRFKADFAENLIPEDPNEEEKSPQKTNTADSGTPELEPLQLEWKLPDELEFANLEELPEPDLKDSLRTMFHFFPDGAAAGTGELRLECKSQARIFSASALTGIVTGRECQDRYARIVH